MWVSFCFTVGVSATCPTTRLWCKDITAMEMERLHCQLTGKSCEARCGGGGEPQHQPFLWYMHQRQFTWNSVQTSKLGMFFLSFHRTKENFSVLIYKAADSNTSSPKQVLSWFPALIFWLYLMFLTFVCLNLLLRVTQIWYRQLHLLKHCLPLKQAAFVFGCQPVGAD